MDREVVPAEKWGTDAADDQWQSCRYGFVKEVMNCTAESL